MVEKTKPDVYIEEVDPSPATEGVSPSQMGIVGRTQRGPTNVPTKVRSLDQFVRTFGPKIPESLVGVTTEQFFQNDGRVAVVVRVVPDGSLPATVDIDAPAKWIFTAKDVGTWGNTVVVEIRGNVNALDEATPEWDKYDILIKEPDAFGALLATEVFEGVQFLVSTDTDYALTVLNDPLSGSSLITLSEGLGGDPDFFAANLVTGESLGLATGLSAQFSGTFASVPQVIRNTVVIATGAQFVTDDGFGNLIGAVDPSGNNIVSYETGAYDVTFAAVPAASAAVTVNYTQLPSTNDYSMAGGTDGVNVITRNEVTHPDLIAQRAGMYSFDKLRDIVNVVIPDFAGNATVAQDQVDYADTRRDRFVLLQAPLGATVDEALVWKQNSLNRNSRRYSAYYPGIRWRNSSTGAVDLVPALGVVAGIFARTDSNKNVSKAPAGKIDGAIVGAEGPEFTLDETDERRLFERRLNPIVNTAAQGFAIWGARTGQTGQTGLKDNFKHIGPVRTFMFLQEFAYIRLQEFVFENNGRGLQTRIRGALLGDFSSFFDSGLFAGLTKKDAFFIICDGSNNTEEDIDNGIINVDIGVALNLPAEFVVVRFQQKTAVRI